MHDLDLIRAYMHAWDDYQKTKRLTELANEKSLELLANFVDGLELKVREIRAAELRKFVLTQSDELYLTRIHNAITNLGLIPLDHSSVATLEEILKNIQTGSTGPIAIHEADGADATPDSKIVRDAIYGGFLHGDVAKRERTHHRNSMSVNLALFGWISYVESICGFMYQMCAATVENGKQN